MGQEGAVLVASSSLSSCQHVCYCNYSFCLKKTIEWRSRLFNKLNVLIDGENQHCLFRL